MYKFFLYVWSETIDFKKYKKLTFFTLLFIVILIWSIKINKYKGMKPSIIKIIIIKTATTSNIYTCSISNILNMKYFVYTLPILSWARPFSFTQFWFRKNLHLITRSQWLVLPVRSVTQILRLIQLESKRGPQVLQSARRRKCSTTHLTSFFLPLVYSLFPFLSINMLYLA